MIPVDGGSDPHRSEHDEGCWRAVLARDPAAEGRFVYAVNTTGVFCRPTCAARRPRRDHVRFFSDPAAALAAGFRACRRCRPLAPAADGERTALIERLCARLATDEPPSLATLAAEAGLSRWHLQRVFRAYVGVSPKQYALACRAGRVRHSLRTSATVTEAIYDSGFNSNSRFYASASVTLGMTPSHWRKLGQGERIRYTITAAAGLGSMLVALSSRGICAIEFADDPKELVASLRQRFPRAEVIADDPGVRDCVAAIAAHLAAPRRPLTLPLDIRGTAFQQRVWQALGMIAPGRTVSYQDLAHAIGQPKAVRAVARACASNALAVAIPCHRVIGADGALTGYRWGIERKRRLLAAERAAVTETPAAAIADVTADRIEGDG